MVVVMMVAPTAVAHVGRGAVLRGRNITRIVISPSHFACENKTEKELKQHIFSQH